MTNLGLMEKFLGVQFLQTDRGIFLHQTDYNLSIISEYSTGHPAHVPLVESIKHRKDTGTPPVDQKQYQGLVGKLLYLTKTRLEIGFATSLSSRYMHGLQQFHLDNALCIVNYI